MKYQFSIRTRCGQVVDHLRIFGVDQTDAERRLRQMYKNAEVTNCEIVDKVLKHETSCSIENLLSLISSPDKE